jgi:hypothetical protein
VCARGRGTGPQRVFALLLSLAVGCNWMGGGGKEKSDAPAPQGGANAGDGFETGWLGHVSRTYPGGLAETTDAAKAALKRLDIDVDPDKAGMFETTLEGESRDGTSLIVIVKEVTRETTRVAIKVGYLLGDGDKARRIHSEIESELKARRDEEALRRQRWGSGRTSTTMPPAATARPPGAP